MNRGNPNWKTSRKGINKGVRGPPRKELNWAQIKIMCAIDCTQEEIAAVCQCHIDTLNDNAKRLYGKTFKEFLEENRQVGNVSLRRAQWKKAVDQMDNTMMIWLGKNRLGQRDKVEATHTGEFKAVLNFRMQEDKESIEDDDGDNV